MSNDWSLWLPVAVLFIGAIAAAFLKRYARDACLKLFHNSFVFIKFKNGRWISGRLIVYSNSLELLHPPEQKVGDFTKTSYVIYENEQEGIEKILRPSPKVGTSEFNAWQKEIHGLRHPSFYRSFMREARNFFNAIRDAFAQSIGMVFGIMKKRTRFSQTNADDRVGELGKTLISAVPNAYEPILEKYLGHYVIVQSSRNQIVFDQVGILQEYTSGYLLTRDVHNLTDLPPESDWAGHTIGQFDVAFPRPANIIRNRASNTPV